MNTGIAIRRIRSALGITQGEFSELTGLSPSMISSLESGDRSLSETALENLLTVLSLSEEEFDLIAVENIEQFERRYRRLAQMGQNLILKAIATQYSARKKLGVLA